MVERSTIDRVLGEIIVICGIAVILTGIEIYHNLALGLVGSVITGSGLYFSARSKGS